MATSTSTAFFLMACQAFSLSFSKTFIRKF
jgi:hypothetical protein